MKWKFQQIEPQAARGKFHEGLWKDPNYWMEIKYDGFRMVGQFCDSMVRLTSRRISDVTGLYQERTLNLPHISGIEQVEGFKLKNKTYKIPPQLDGTVLDGEIVLDVEHLKKVRAQGGGISKAVGSIVNSDPSESIRKMTQRGYLRYIVFDCLYWKGADIRQKKLVDRWEYAACAVRTWGSGMVEMAAKYGLSKNNAEIYKDLLLAGEEGVIFKRKDHLYGDQSGWIKKKKTDTADVVIMGFIPAKEMSVKKGDDKATITKYAKAGLIGAIRCGQYVVRDGDVDYPDLTEVATVSGMTDDLRKRLTLSPRTYKGRVITIEHNGREPTGRFRHPRLADNTDPFRDDKRAKDCVYREDES